MAEKKSVEKKRVDPETKYRERFRMIKMKESLDSLADVCFGRNASVLPHITNSKGEISKKKVGEFKTELVDLMEECRINIYGGPFSEEERTLAESITLIALLTSGTWFEYPLEEDEEGNMKKPFSDNITFAYFLSLMKEAYPPMTEEDYRSTYEEGARFGFTSPDHFFSYIGNLADILNFSFRPEKEKTTGKGRETINLPEGSEPHRKTPAYFFRCDSEYMAESDKEYEENLDENGDYVDWKPSEEDLEYIAEMEESPEFQAFIQEQGEELSREADSLAEVFPMKEQFIRACRDYRKLVFRVYPDNFAEMAEMAVNLFLIRRNLSPLAEQEDFWQVHAECTLAKNHILRNCMLRRDKR
jgi:hypothetical protein